MKVTDCAPLCHYTVARRLADGSYLVYQKDALRDEKGTWGNEGKNKIHSGGDVLVEQ